MSADNYIGVRKDKEGWSIVDGCMSILDEDCMYDGRLLNCVSTRGEALIYAHDHMKDQYIVEYGVIEVPPIPEKPCGRCYVCVNVRHNVAEDIQRCDGCGDPISTSEWMTMTHQGTFHNRCEPERV